MIVVATQRATAARVDFAIPNIGQIVEIDPDQMKAAQAVTTKALVTIEPGSQFWLFSFAIEAPAKLPDKETRHPRAGVDRSEYEKSFKHNCEVIPILHQTAQTRNAVEDFGDTEGQRYSSARCVHANFSRLTLVRVDQSLAAVG